MATSAVNNFFNRLLNTPPPEGEVKIPMARKAENAESLARGEIPSGVSMEMLIQQELSRPAPDTSMEDAAIRQSIKFATDNGAKLGEITNAAFNAGNTLMEAGEDKLQADEEADLIKLNKSLGLEERMQSVLDARSDQRTEIQNQYNQTVDEMKADLDLSQKADTLGLGDLLLNPIKFVKLRVDSTFAK
jgi:hypothetical protein